MTPKTSDYWIALAKRAGIIAHHTHRGARFSRRRVTCPRVLILALALRKDGTVTAARRAFDVGFTEGR